MTRLQLIEGDGLGDPTIYVVVPSEDGGETYIGGTKAELLEMFDRLRAEVEAMPG